MFEKSLYDLIRGLRNHRGKEREYIQASIRECRKEIQSQDMDLKATAVLKLTYLEMFGHDMSWASFNILEVMSSPKFLQKRVGYLGAVQSFRPDTEVLMLAENLLKKDLASTNLSMIGLPLGAIPHVANPSMANSLLSDILSRLTHSNPGIRKKTIATLYRLCLVYPETLRPAWPKIKERLADENEDPSVTSAVVNVVCELGWRRPHDFLPLAPRLFDLLVSGGNNWMAIKIIKLFATLTPLEPRLVNKLLPPLNQIIKTTPAMSLLYECINGIIQGGVLEAAQGTTKGDEVARLCVGKLRGMLMIEGDPNMKYVALLAFNSIVELHPYLVTNHEDIVIECIDDVDISIRLRALDLVVGMVNPQNLVPIVERLMKQLQDAPFASAANDPQNDRGASEGVMPQADEDDEDMEQSLNPNEKRRNDTPPLPDDYRVSIIRKILSMCSRDTYANINDFDWYIEVLIQLVHCVPATGVQAEADASRASHRTSVAYEVGSELRNIAVRVKSSREETTRAAELLVSVDQRDRLFPASGNGAIGVLEPSAWVVGEFSHLLLNPNGTLDSFLHSSTSQLPTEILSAYLQAITKLYSHLAGDDRLGWTSERRTMVSLLTAKVSHFLESLTTHPSVEVQERAVEYLELSRIAAEAASSHEVDSEGYQQPPLLLTQAIPALFSGMELNPVAKDAQSKVPIPDGLDLDKPINENLSSLLSVSDVNNAYDTDSDFHTYYHSRPQHTTQTAPEPAAKRLDPPSPDPSFSYQDQNTNGTPDDTTTLKRKAAARRDRNKDDPFYIPSSDDNSGRATPIHHIIRSNNPEALDVDSIPIMELDLDDPSAAPARPPLGSAKSSNRKTRKVHDILADETIDSSASAQRSTSARPPASRAQKSLLQVDSSGLGAFSLDSRGGQLDAETREAEEAEMQQAMREVERLRLEMQRKAERVEGAGEGEGEGTAVTRRRKKVKSVPAGEGGKGAVGGVVGGGVGVGDGEGVGEGGAAKKGKKKKKKVKGVTNGAEEQPVEQPVEVEAAEEPTTEAALKPRKKKKRRQITFDEDDGGG